MPEISQHQRFGDPLPFNRKDLQVEEVVEADGHTRVCTSGDLADGKRMPSAELEKAVNERGISSRTMRTAKSRIGDRLVTEKDGTAWVCYLRN